MVAKLWLDNHCSGEGLVNGQLQYYKGIFHSFWRYFSKESLCHFWVHYMWFSANDPISRMSWVNSMISWYCRDISTYHTAHFIQCCISQAWKERAAESNSTHLFTGNQCETLLSSALLKSRRQIITYSSFKCLTRGSFILSASTYLYWESRGRFQTSLGVRRYYELGEGTWYLPQEDLIIRHFIFYILLIFIFMFKTLHLSGLLYGIKILLCIRIQH